MKRSPHGFTLIELVVALLVGSILTSIALSSFGSQRARFAVRGARNTFVSVHARARAHAIERGRNVNLVVDVDGDSVVVVDDRDGTTIENIRFAEELNVDVRSSGGVVTLCMNSRGYADDGCGNVSSSGQTVEFWASGDSTTVRILPLGQLIY